MPKIEVNGLELAYEALGSGPPALLIHGSFGTRAGWQVLTPFLEGAVRLVMYDRRGHGESGGQPEAGTVHDDVADAAALIEALELGSAHVVAHSYGACIALRLASERPELIRRMVCHEPPLVSALEATPEGRALAESALADQAEVRWRLEAGDIAGGVEYFVEEVAFGPGAWARLPGPVREELLANAGTYLGELRDPDALRIDLGQLRSVEAPVLLTQGDQSEPAYGQMLDQIAAALPCAERRVIEGAGHAPSATHPQPYGAVVREFLARP
jgi:pimeloyl-ACP methyl ester carboxylesterase